MSKHTCYICDEEADFHITMVDRNDTVLDDVWLCRGCIAETKITDVLTAPKS